MSLDTVLQIGKVLRSSENSLKYFKYIEPCPKDKDGHWPICISIPLMEDFSINWKGVSITPENQREKLYYLKFKTSDSDGLVKYVFGDIYFEKKVSVKKDGIIDVSEGGYYRLENPGHSNAAYRLSSFNRGFNDYEDIIKPYKNEHSITLQKFHEKLNNDIDKVERLLKYIPAILPSIEEKDSECILSLIDDESLLYSKTVEQVYYNIPKNILKKLLIPSDYSQCDETHKRLLFNMSNAVVFIHFKFPVIEHWYMSKTEMDLINSKILFEFVDNTQNGLVLKKALYKTLCSGDKKNDIQFPFFKNSNKYKAKNFHTDELQDLFYAIDYTSKGKLIAGTDIKLIVLPRGEHLKAEDYDSFLEKRDEAKIRSKNIDNQLSVDPIFDFVSDENQSITSFDLIFCKKGGQSSPDNDLIELSGIQKSNISLMYRRIDQISREINSERKIALKTDKELFPITIESAFKEILGNIQNDRTTGKISFKANARYKSHLIKVLPLIFTQNYYHDEILLPAFIENIEASVRFGDPKYVFLKYDLKFLFNIQNSTNNKFMEITKSESYQIGLMLGELARNLSQEINSFEKNYVGNLTRRVGSIADVIKLKNEIEQKLILHDKTRFTFQISYDLAQQIKGFLGRYDKEECAFGFMESYFKPLPKKDSMTVKVQIEI